MRSILDGYLGTIRTRRDDRGKPYGTSERVLDSLKTRVTQRSYQRGVHRGERIDPSDYYYPDKLRPERGISRQMRAVREGNVIRTQRNGLEAVLTPAPHLPNDGKANTVSTSLGEINARRQAQLARMKPRWQ